MPSRCVWQCRQRVREFLYRESEYTVWYDADAEKTYRVYHNSDMIDTGE
ncbi:MAG: hypothetical protein V8Q27_03950 [Eubacteriales bacterium]